MITWFSWNIVWIWFTWINSKRCEFMPILYSDNTWRSREVSPNRSWNAFVLSSSFVLVLCAFPPRGTPCTFDHLSCALWSRGRLSRRWGWRAGDCSILGSRRRWSWGGRPRGSRPGHRWAGWLITGLFLCRRGPCPGRRCPVRWWPRCRRSRAPRLCRAGRRFQSGWWADAFTCRLHCRWCRCPPQPIPQCFGRTQWRWPCQRAHCCRDDWRCNGRVSSDLVFSTDLPSNFETMS